MASVPNNTTYGFVNGVCCVPSLAYSSLCQALINGCDSWFDPTYKCNKCCMLNLRNYTEVTGYDVTVDTCYVGGGECACGTWFLNCCTGAPVDSRYIETSYGCMCFTVNSVPSGCYYVDFSNVLSYNAGVPITTFYMWSIDIDGYGYGCCTGNFNLNTNGCVSSTISDGMS
jgi:hypothetical protein